MKKMKITLLAAFLVISLIVILYPLIANRLAEKNASLIETQYTERIETLYDTELQELRDQAARYKETGVMHIVSNMNYSAQLNAVMEAMDYAVPEAGKEEKSAKKAKPRAPQEKSSEERGIGLNKATDTTHEKPSVRQRLAALDAMAKEMSRNAPVKQNEKTR